MPLLEAEALESKTNKYDEAQEKKRLIKKDSHPCCVSSENRKKLFTFSALWQPSQEPLDRLETVSQSGSLWCQYTQTFSITPSSDSQKEKSMPYGDTHEYMPNHLFVPKQTFSLQEHMKSLLLRGNCSGNYQVFLYSAGEGPAGALIIPRSVHTYANQGPAESRLYAGHAPVARTNQLQKAKPNCGVTWIVHKYPAISKSPQSRTASLVKMAFGTCPRRETWTQVLETLPDLSPHAHAGCQFLCFPLYQECVRHKTGTG